jgi:hypothetical protein
MHACHKLSLLRPGGALQLALLKNEMPAALELVQRISK